MYQRILFLFMLLNSIHFSGLSQSHPTGADIQMGEEMKGSRRGTLEDIVGFDKSGYYVLRWENSKEVMLEQYDHKLNQMKTEELDLGKGREEREYEFILQMDEQLYLFSSFNDSKTKQNILYTQKISKATLKPEPTLKKVAAMDYSRKRNDGSFGYKLAADSSHVLIYYNLPYDKGEPEQFGFNVVDKDMNVKWHKDVVLPYKDELFAIERHLVDQKGNVYVLGRVYQGKAKEKNKGLPNYEYHVLAYLGQGNAFKEYTVSLKQNFITDIQIAIKHDGELIGSGFYSEKGTTTIKGTFYVTLDANSKRVSKETLQQFEKGFLEEFMSEKKAKKGRELYEYDLDKLVMRTDGGAVLVAEQYYWYTTTHRIPNGGSYTTTHYNYNDLIVVNINPNGTIDWAKKIPKKQASANDGGFYSSYVFSVCNNNMYFIFNDNPKNLLADDSDKTYNFGGGKDLVVVMVKMDAQGKSDKQALFNTRESEVIIRPKVCEQVSENEVILFGQRKSIYRFAKITMKQRNG